MPAATRLLIAGGGICGLASALAVARAGWEVRVFERARALTEVGAGLQLGPNATRLLIDWGLGAAVRAVAAAPERVVVRSAVTGAELAALPLSAAAERHYGAPYLTLHRADLHAVLLGAVRAQAGVTLALDRCVTAAAQTDDGAQLATAAGLTEVGAALLGADGLHSAVRASLLRDGAPRSIGDVAYRTLLAIDGIPAPARANEVTAWLGPQLHVVQYPVRRGAAMNLVVLVHGARHAAASGWDHTVEPAVVEGALQASCAPLRALAASARTASLNRTPWGLWVLADRPPVAGAAQMARGRVALAGDAAHPMRPYLAQGAGMAIEDAAALAAALAEEGLPVPQRLQRYAAARWQRCAHVQARSERNSTIFHARGPLRLARDLSLRLLGEQLMDMPWLYGYRAGAAAAG